jgi:hypothetical protein
MDVNCNSGSPGCYDPAGAPRLANRIDRDPAFGRGAHSSQSGGVLSTSTSSYDPAYGTANGWDFATGIGSVNVWLLITNWP